jgi:hypothetical protein
VEIDSNKPDKDDKDAEPDVKITIQAPVKKREAVGVGAKGGEEGESEGDGEGLPEGSTDDLPNEPEVLPDVPDAPPAEPSDEGDRPSE